MRSQALQRVAARVHSARPAAAALPRAKQQRQQRQQQQQQQPKYLQPPSPWRQQPHNLHLQQQHLQQQQQQQQPGGSGHPGSTELHGSRSLDTDQAEDATPGSVRVDVKLSVSLEELQDIICLHRRGKLRLSGNTRALLTKELKRIRKFDFHRHVSSLQEHLEGCYPDVGHDASAPAACAGRDGAFSAGGTSSVGGTFGGAGAAGIPFEQQL
mmetsp:Transcript_42655/g.128028  ORF Transcript_42655/g.128028 Transcript_42655/m.128028 type:complete len:212 (-) Transcript_42655:30-665(-)